METIFVLLCILSAVTVSYTGAPPGFFPFGGTSGCRIEAANKCVIKQLYLLFLDDDGVDQPCNIAKRTACLFHGGGNHAGPKFNRRARGPTQQLTCDEGKFLKAACSAASDQHCDCHAEHPDWCNTESQNTKFLTNTGSCADARGSTLCDFSSPSDSTDCEGLRPNKKKKTEKAKKSDE